MLSPTQTLRLGELLRLFEAENAAEAPPNDGVPTSAEAEAPLAAPLADEALSPAHPTPSTPLPTLSQAVFALPMDDLITLLAKCPHCALEVPTAAVPFHAVVEESEFWSTPRSQAAEEALVAFDSANPSDPFAIVRLNNKFAIRTGVLAVSEPHDEALSIVRRGMDDHPVERRQIAAMKLETRRIESIWSSPQLVPPPPEEWERLWDGDLADPDAVFAGAADTGRRNLVRKVTIQLGDIFTSEEKKRRSYPLYKTACNALANLWSEFEFEEVIISLSSLA
ncbi:hypothetical protein RQP46_010758 [Phenoliferia psychrophenolica]